MDKNQEEKKGINLMPEDMRSKESSILSKVKSKGDFDFDFVSPDGSSVKKMDSQRGISWWDKIKNFFNKSASFSQDKSKSEDSSKDKKASQSNNDKIVGQYSPQRPKSVEGLMHVPDKEEKHSDNYAVDYKNKFSDEKKVVSEDEYTPISTPSFSQSSEDDKEDNQEKKDSISWWDKIKSWFKFSFSSKDKAPKVERVPDKPIVPRPPQSPPIIKDNFESSEDKDVEDIFGEDDKKIPRLDNSQKQNMQANEKIETVSQDEVKERSAVGQMETPKKTSDFFIPGMEERQMPPSPPQSDDDNEDQDEDEEDKPSKFHTPDARIRARFLDEGGGVDLIPDAVKVRSWRQISILLLITIFGIIFIIGAFYGFLFYQSQQLQKQRDAEFAQITNLERQIVDYKELNDEITGLGDKIKRIHKLLSLHFYWTNFFQLLEKYTIDGVYYSGMEAGNGGAMTLEAKADSFEVLAKQIKILQQEDAKEFVSEINVGSAQIESGQEDISFSITLILNPSLFLYDENYLYEINNVSLDQEQGDDQ